MYMEHIHSSIFSLVSPETGNFKSSLKFMEKGKICLEMVLSFGMPKIGWLRDLYLVPRITSMVWPSFLTHTATTMDHTMYYI